MKRSPIDSGTRSGVVCPQQKWGRDAQTSGPVATGSVPTEADRTGEFDAPPAVPLQRGDSKMATVEQLQAEVERLRRDLRASELAQNGLMVLLAEARTAASKPPYWATRTVEDGITTYKSRNETWVGPYAGSWRAADAIFRSLRA
jgi:hypothetical protein